MPREKDKGSNLITTIYVRCEQIKHNTASWLSLPLKAPPVLVWTGTMQQLWAYLDINITLGFSSEPPLDTPLIMCIFRSYTLAAVLQVMYIILLVHKNNWIRNNWKATYYFVSRASFLTSHQRDKFTWPRPIISRNFHIQGVPTWLSHNVRASLLPRGTPIIYAWIISQLQCLLFQSC